MQGEVYADLASRGRYATDASIYQVMPLAVAVPKTVLDFRVALDVARDAGLPVLPRGAGTSQCGQTVGEALVMTAAGLAVAIPAVLAYNLFGKWIGQCEAQLEGFAHDLRELMLDGTAPATLRRQAD